MTISQKEFLRFERSLSLNANRLLLLLPEDIVCAAFDKHKEVCLKFASHKRLINTKRKISKVAKSAKVFLFIGAVLTIFHMLPHTKANLAVVFNWMLFCRDLVWLAALVVVLPEVIFRVIFPKLQTALKQAEHFEKKATSVLDKTSTRKKDIVLYNTKIATYSTGMKIEHFDNSFTNCHSHLVSNHFLAHLFELLPTSNIQKWTASVLWYALEVQRSVLVAENGSIYTEDYINCFLAALCQTNDQDELNFFISLCRDSSLLVEEVVELSKNFSV